MHEQTLHITHYRDVCTVDGAARRTATVHTLLLGKVGKSFEVNQKKGYSPPSEDRKNMPSSSSDTDAAKRTVQALDFLRQVKPHDAWSIDRFISSSGKTLVMLRRRNIALVDIGFEELFFDEINSGSVFGVVSYIESTETSSITNPSTRTSHARVMELVDMKGNLIRNPEKNIQRMSLPPVNIDSRNNVSKKDSIISKPSLATSISSSTPSASSSSSTVNSETMMTEEQSKKILQYGIMGFGSLVLLKLILSSSIIYCLFLPLVILYALQTCPLVETFDAKKELKRILRGKYLPQEQQPKDWFTKTMVRVQATIGTELATGLGGYEAQFIPVMGVCVMAFLQVPLLNTEYIWIGIFGKWVYIYQRALPSTTIESSSH